MLLAALGATEYLVILGFLAAWVAVLVWIVRGKSRQWAKIGAAGCLVIATGWFISMVMEAVNHRPYGSVTADERPRSGPVQLAKNQRIVIGSDSQQAVVYNIDNPCSLQVEVVELLGKNIEFRVLQDGRSVFSSGVHVGKAVGTMPLEKGAITVSLVNDNLLESKTVQLSVVATTR